MRILFASANSAHAYMDIEREHRTLQKFADGGGCSLRALPAAEIEDLSQALRAPGHGGRYDIFHFSGHITGERGLELRGNGRAREILGGQRLASMLAGSGIKLAVLNACQSAWLANLLSEVVPAAIGTTRKVRDVAARQFTRDFYGALTDGMGVESAFCTALKRQKQSATPAYMHAGCLPRDADLPTRRRRDGRMRIKKESA